MQHRLGMAVDPGFEDRKICLTGSGKRHRTSFVGPGRESITRRRLGNHAGLPARFEKIDAIFTITDIEEALKHPKAADIQASARQDPYAMAKLAVKIGIGLINGKKPDQVTTLIPSKLVTRDNVNEYVGWAADR